MNKYFFPKICNLIHVLYGKNECLPIKNATSNWCIYYEKRKFIKHITPYLNLKSKNREDISDIRTIKLSKYKKIREGGKW